MAIVRRKLRDGRISYWVKFTWNGADVWERAGTNERQAKALESQRRREVKSGTYQRERKGRTLVSRWFADWLAARKNRTVDNDRALIDRHVLSLDWFTSMAMSEVRTRHLLKLVADIRAAGRLGEKSLSTVMGLVKTSFVDAHVAEVVFEKIELPRGTFTRKTAPANRRRPYRREEVRALLSCQDLRPDVRVWLAIAFFTGMREGEICGRKWKDWDRAPRPLSALSVHTQYDDQPLKGDDRDMTRPRMVPVHPELEELLRWWRSEGYELVHRRAPAPEDCLVPQADGTPHTKSSGYKMFQRALGVAKVANRSLHSTRHTFISVARSAGARVEVLERVTHNASGALVDPHGTIDDYTEFEWRPICEAVALVDYDVDPNANRAVFGLQSLDSNQVESVGNTAESNGTRGKRLSSERGLKPAEKQLPEAMFDARHRRAQKFGEVDPEGARAGISLFRGLVAAQSGDRDGAERALRDMSEEMGFAAPSLQGRTIAVIAKALREDFLDRDPNFSRVLDDYARRDFE